MCSSTLGRSMTWNVPWMFVNIRVLGKPPRLPAYGDDLIRYAAALEVQYSRLCKQPGIARRSEAATLACQLTGLLGLTEAAEPLLPRLLALLERHRR
jgi:hypothetical protein